MIEQRNAPELETPEAIAAHLTEAFHTNDPSHIALAVGHAIRAKGASAIAKQTDLSRENLYRAFISAQANPSLNTFVRILDALGIRLEARPKDKTARRHRAT